MNTIMATVTHGLKWPPEVAEQIVMASKIPKEYARPTCKRAIDIGCQKCLGSNAIDSLTTKPTFPCKVANDECCHGSRTCADKCEPPKGVDKELC